MHGCDGQNVLFSKVLTECLGFTFLLVTRLREMVTDWPVFGACPCFVFADQTLAIYSADRISDDVC